MAVAITSLAHYEDGAEYTVATAGTNPLLLALVLMSDNVATVPSISDASINSTAFPNEIAAVVADGAASPYLKAYWVHFKGSDGYPSTGTYQADISTTDANDGSCIMDLTGVDQTNPIVSHDAQKATSSNNFPSHTITCAEGDLVIVQCSTASGAAISAPGAIGGVDSFTDEYGSGNANLIGGSLNNGKVFSCITSQAHEAQSFNATRGGSPPSVLYSQCIVVRADTGGGGGGSIVPIVLQHNHFNGGIF